MRVVGGLYRSRRLVAPEGLAVRPTPDRVREALFGILSERARGAWFLDLFAGSGAVGIEALSRGAESVVFVESDRTALASLDRNLEALGIAGRVRVIRSPWPGALEACLATFPHGQPGRLRPGELDASAHAPPSQREPSPAGGSGFSIVFADPPYAEARYAEILRSLSGPALLRPGALVVLEHDLRDGVPEEGGALSLTRIARYGRVGLAFYAQRPAESGSPGPPRPSV